jgi:peptidoglycan/LPS O-acetylase OafA/YrhL
MIKHIHGFDGLRAFSILFVLITHLGVFDMLPDYPYVRERIWLLFSGTTGVNIFFTISGFLITLLLLAEHKAKGRIQFKNFFIRRFLRLLPPLLVLYLALVVLMLTGIIPTDYLAMGISAFYMYNFVPSWHYTEELGHTWSLGVEEQYYLIWPYLLSWFHRKSGIKIIIGVIVLLSIATIYFFSDYNKIMQLGGKIQKIAQYFKINRWIIPAVSTIIIGSTGALYVFKKPDVIRAAFERKRIILFISILIIFSCLYIPRFLLPIFAIIQAIGVCGLLIWIYFNQDSTVSKILSFKPLSYIGKISYGLYVYQGLFLRTGPGGEWFFQKFPNNVILTVATAILSYHLLEKQVLKWKNRFR